MSENMSSAQSLGNIIRDRKFRVPLYQRNYKWNEKVAEKLVQDLLKAYQKDTIKSIGLITLYEDKNTGIYDVIDGQQRLITLSILFSLLPEQNPVKLCFERDDKKKSRKKTLYNAKNTQKGTTDTDRINRNRKAMRIILCKHCKEKNYDLDLLKFKDFILKKCSMLCSVIKNPPVEEFMNLNAYKTAFSVCDYVRSNLIMLNTFYKTQLEEKISDIIGGLSRYTYKTAVAELYNRILDILYTEETEKVFFSSPYKVLINTSRCHKVLNADNSNESRINVLFGVPEGSQNYRYEPENRDFDEWKQELIRLSWIYRLLERLKNDMKNGDFSSAKAIDNYEKLKGGSFISLLLELKDTDKDLSLSELLNKYSNVNNVLIRQINSNDLKLANRYFEAFASACENKATNNAAETDSYCPTHFMTEDEIIASISGTGRYMLDRFLVEQHYQTDSTSIIPPILDLEDKENINLGGELNDVDNDTITVGNLFKNTIKIPVIQRDYCMGAQLNREKNNFLTYLITNFKNRPDELLNISTILVSKEQNCNAVYIFDGQQRTFTLYQILKYSGYFDNKDHKDNGFEFIGRGHQEYGSSYSKKAVKDLQKQLETLKAEKLDKEAFINFLLNKIIFTVKQIDDVSSAEQFFMDINGGVALEPYEIYKSCLYDRLTRIDSNFARKFMLKLENNWLNAIYTLLKIQENDDSDKEEITEIRLIEYLCRYFYKEKTKKTAEAFDTLSSKSTIVEKARAYLDKLELEDFKNIRKCMNCFIKYLNANISYIAKINGKDYEPYYNDLSYIRTVEFNSAVNKSDILSLIIPSFVSSFSPEKRKKLLYFYSCSKSWEGHKWLIENIYDNDEFADYIIQLALNKPEPTVSYRRPVKVADAVFVGGYKVRNIGNYKIYETEIPAYYADMSCIKNSFPTIRPYYLYEQAGKQANNKNKVAFFLTEGKETIKHPNGTNTLFSLSKHDELEVKTEIKDHNNRETGMIFGQNNSSYLLTFRTDAYRICNSGTRSFLLD